ncbi:MAG: transglutaminase family protein [Candidatus Kapaibacterium sp.]|nr:MAG: transglutaminase family protein [Candidatus Kapabacteria bacterium]
MFFRISHRTRYTYTDRVFLEAQTLRLVPRTDAAQRCHSFSLELAPHFAGMAHIHDLDGNPAVQVWFDRLCDYFEVTTHAVVETFCTNPFNFLLTVSEELPFEYPAEMQTFLQPFLAQKSLHSDVAAFSKRIAEESNEEIMPFLSNLTIWIFNNVEQIVRNEGNAYESHITLRSCLGSCRDTAVLFMDACRARGLAARFVSGYVLYTGTAETERHLHAWAEVYLPGAGWRAYDPSRGLAVAEAHIALASGYTPSLASPVSGVYRSNNARSELSFFITLEEFPTLEAALGQEKRINAAL